MFFFFFSSRRRHTRSDRDWIQTCALPISSWNFPARDRAGKFHDAIEIIGRHVVTAQRVGGHADPRQADEIGRASCREREEISVVAVSFKKKKDIEEDSCQHRMR